MALLLYICATSSCTCSRDQGLMILDDEYSSIRVTAMHHYLICGNVCKSTMPHSASNTMSQCVPTPDISFPENRRCRMKGGLEKEEPLSLQYLLWYKWLAPSTQKLLRPLLALAIARLCDLQICVKCRDGRLAGQEALFLLPSVECSSNDVPGDGLLQPIGLFTVFVRDLCTDDSLLS